MNYVNNHSENITITKDKNLELNILTASNGLEAVNICNEREVDLIFMDLMMQKHPLNLS